MSIIRRSVAAVALAAAIVVAGPLAAGDPGRVPAIAGDEHPPVPVPDQPGDTHW